MKDIIKIAVVNFDAIWGNKKKNIEKMRSYIKNAARQNVNLIVFPETALTGYDNEEPVTRSQKMQTLQAESIHGATATIMSALAAKYNIYIVFGFPEKENETVYNSAAIIYPNGTRLSYKKIHLPADEPKWADAGDTPLVFNTEYGPIGISICYDTYNFPELIRYCKAKGARLHLNPTACGDAVYHDVPLQKMLEVHALTCSTYIASADLCGKDKDIHFIGGSSVIGVNPEHKAEPKYYCGHPFGSEESDYEEMYVTEIDLSLSDTQYATPMFVTNEYTKKTDFRPEVYSEMYKELALDNNSI